jgi:peptidoglycan/LPS O-acetylase OafA/YrhL
MAGLPGASIAECGGYFFSGCAIFLLFTRYASRPAMLFAFAGAFICLGVSILPGSFGVVGLIVGGLMMIAGAEASAGSAAPKSLRWFGDATYGIYLWHAPLQIIALIILDSHGSRAIVDSPWFLTGFIVMVVGVGHFSYVYVEAPARRLITRLAVGREQAASACSKPVSTTLMHPRCSTLR